MKHNPTQKDHLHTKKCSEKIHYGRRRKEEKQNREIDHFHIQKKKDQRLEIGHKKGWNRKKRRS